eukprot:11173750-Alexandrium_andersonii.AAC.1
MLCLASCVSAAARMQAPRRRAPSMASSPWRCQEATLTKQARMVCPCAPGAREAGRLSRPGSCDELIQLSSGCDCEVGPSPSLSSEVGS